MQHTLSHFQINRFCQFRIEFDSNQHRKALLLSSSTSYIGSEWNSNLTVEPLISLPNNSAKWSHRMLIYSRLWFIRCQVWLHLGDQSKLKICSECKKCLKLEYLNFTKMNTWYGYRKSKNSNKRQHKEMHLSVWKQIS